MIDCVIQTEQLVITIEGKRTEPISSATSWYPRRSQLVRNLEAAKHLANGRAWGTLLMSETALEEGTDAGLDAVLADSTPHLDAAERNELHAAYLGNLTWERACDAVGIPPGSLPDTTLDI